MSANPKEGADSPPASGNYLPPPTILTPSLFRPDRFERAIDRIARRRAGAPSEVELEVEGLSLRDVWRERAQAAVHLSHDLATGRLPAPPGTLTLLRRGSKYRRTYTFPLSEMIVHDVVAEWLAEIVEPLYSPRLHSYRTGHSNFLAVREFAAYVRAHAPDTTLQRGLFVIKRDIEAFFDSVPLEEGSEVWQQLDRLAAPAPDGVKDILRRVVNPLITEARRHGPARLPRGLPTGSAVANVVANIYLMDVDAMSDGWPGGHYARYGDDIIIAHPDPSTALALHDRIEKRVHSLGLQFSATKGGNMYLSAAGRPWLASGDFLLGVQRIEFLGYSVSARGEIGLSPQKVRELLTVLRGAAHRAFRACDGSAIDKARCAARVVNSRLDPAHPASHPYSALLRSTVTDRKQLAWLDHEAALILLETITGKRNVRGFREWPPLRLRQDAGLKSLVAARNQA